MKEKDDSILNKTISEDNTILNASLLSKNYLLAKGNVKEKNLDKKKRNKKIK